VGSSPISGRLVSDISAGGRQIDDVALSDQTIAFIDHWSTGPPDSYLDDLGAGELIDLGHEKPDYDFPPRVAGCSVIWSVGHARSRGLNHACAPCIWCSSPATEMPWFKALGSRLNLLVGARVLGSSVEHWVRSGSGEHHAVDDLFDQLAVSGEPRRRFVVHQDSG
jgi:hypothetical protein